MEHKKRISKEYPGHFLNIIQMNEDFQASKLYSVFQLFLEQLYQSRSDVNLWINDSFESHINESDDPVHIWMVHLQTS